MSQEHERPFLSRFVRAFFLFGVPLALWHYIRDTARLPQQYEVPLAVTSALANALVFALLQVAYERWKRGAS